MSSKINQYAEHSPGNVGIAIHRYSIFQIFFSPPSAINDHTSPAFLDALTPLLDSGITKFNKRCVSVQSAPSGRQVIHFADNTTYEADIVIGADGIRSITRNAVVSGGRLVFSNTYAYRGLIPIDALNSAGLKTTDVQFRPHCWVGLGRVCIIFT